MRVSKSIMLCEKLSTKCSILYDYLYQLSEEGKITVTESRLMAAYGQEGWTAVGHKESFEGDGNVLHLDCGISQVYVSVKTQ